MSASATLNSRLRVLVAKTFRAEKLYSSIRNTKRDTSVALSSVSEAANELRAKEWQKSHYELRLALNEILNLGTTSEQSKHLLMLRERFANRVEESAAGIEKAVDSLSETANRQEFAHVLKLSLELIRLKACAQSNKVIAEELTALLSKSGRTTDASGIDPADLDKISIRESSESPQELPANVISLAKRRAAGGSGSR